MPDEPTGIRMPRIDLNTIVLMALVGSGGAGLGSLGGGDDSRECDMKIDIAVDLACENYDRYCKENE